MKYPIGVQGFEKLRTEGYLYIDKTRYIYKMAQEGGQFFLSRPRRFGKSLLLSAMRAYWEGRRELFHGLEIEALEERQENPWQEYPVFYFDFNGQNYASRDALEEVLDQHLKRWEKQYDLPPSSSYLSGRFQDLLIHAREQTGRRCVVLVDEYDKALLESLEDPQREEHNKEVFKGFFGTLKSYDDCLQFVFIAGVTKFSKVSIFCDLNQLRDISLSEDYAGLCGITEAELLENFTPEVELFAAEQGMSADECFAMLKKTYDGYHFHPYAEGVYNPFSLLSALADRDFRSYWFSTGTPSFLVRRLRRNGFDIRRFTDKTLYANEAALTDFRADNPDMVPLLYQTGYLTILDYDKNYREYTLGFPNEEVKYGFLSSLMPEYVENCGSGSGKDIFTLQRYVRQGKTEEIREVLTALFASIPYTTQDYPFEHYFQSVIYLVFTLLGHYTQCEMHTFKGRVDCVLETEDFVYVFEFKRDDTAEHALVQIDEKGYSLPFAADRRKVYKIGVSFDSESRMLKDWKVAEE